MNKPNKVYMQVQRTELWLSEGRGRGRKGWRWEKGTLEVGGFNLFPDLFLNPQTASTSYKPPMNIHKPIPKPINDGEYLAWSSQVRKLLTTRS